MIFHTQAESDAYHAGYKAGVAARPEGGPRLERAEAIAECLRILGAQCTVQSNGVCCDRCNCQGARYARDAMQRLLNNCSSAMNNG